MLKALVPVGQVPEPNIESLIRTKRVIVCAGCGGVGKTSVAAALSVAAARLGKRVLALTIDPAKRLAESLGVDASCAERQFVDAERLKSLGVKRAGAERDAGGELSVMVLDPQQTLNEMVARLAPDDGSYQRITNHRLYRYLSDYLAGANEYMAMEKLLSVLSQRDYDLLILDTPPTRHALDFLSAPEKLTDAIDGPIMRSVVKAVDGTSRFSLDLVARSVSAIVRGFGKFTGAGMLEQVATLIAELNSIFGGFRERAGQVAAAFRDPSFAYLVVVRPDVAAVDDGRFFVEALQQREMRAAAVVINRVHRPLSAPTIAEGIRELTTKSSPELAKALELTLKEHLAIASCEAEQVARVQAFPGADHLARVQLPWLPSGVSSLAALARLASHLVPEEVVSSERPALQV